MIYPNSTEWGINHEDDHLADADDIVSSQEEIDDFEAYWREKNLDREDSGMAGTG